ncbi:hypothetical protein FML15_15210 [Klebsiella michiganensis]|nr:hypothetical protein [Klebsiella michiganensis]MBZ7766961.1 hypothetical protein [Klebsiella michiganensis]QFI06651.1 hypothetical protein FR848_19095 [Klebsiella michiganensis]
MKACDASRPVPGNPRSRCAYRGYKTASTRSPAKAFTPRAGRSSRSAEPAKWKKNRRRDVGGEGDGVGPGRLPPISNNPAR